MCVCVRVLLHPPCWKFIIVALGRKIFAVRAIYILFSFANGFCSSCMGCSAGSGRGRGFQWGICHVAMFGSLPANKYGALSVSRADGRYGGRGMEGRYKQCHIWQAQVATLLIQLAGCGTFCQVALAPNSYLPLSVSPLSVSITHCPCLPLYWLIKIKSEIKANKIHGNVAKLSYNKAYYFSIYFICSFRGCHLASLAAPKCFSHSHRK